MLLIETVEGNTTNTNREPKEGDYMDDSYENDAYGAKYSDENNDALVNNDLYEDYDPKEYDYYPNEVDRKRNLKAELSASTCRPRRGIGDDVSLNVTCGDRVIIDCDSPQRGSCISRFLHSCNFLLHLNLSLLDTDIMIIDHVGRSSTLGFGE